jgi:N-acetylneuraminic acid mutarotase
LKIFDKKLTPNEMQNLHNNIGISKFVNLSSLPERKEQACVELIGDKIIAVGGINSSSQRHSLSNYVYDIPTNTWERKTDLPIGSQSPICRSYNGKLYFIGGYNSEIATYYNHTYEYDVALDTWTLKGYMPTAREDMASAIVGSKIYVFGGLDHTTLQTNVSEVYDIPTNTWSSIKSMPETKWSGDFGTSYNGKIYLIGSIKNRTGYPESFVSSTSVIEYDPSTDNYTYKSNISVSVAYKELEVLGVYNVKRLRHILPSWWTSCSK